ncbi:MAG: tetratricopeptide repeat protein, partial [Acidobacteriota bacterium]|nr:tetratricopeptide repeat protein [Acidobacteriota bacterium]
RIQENPRPYVLGAFAIVVVALGTWGFTSMSMSRRDRSADRLSRALAAITAQVADPAAATPQDPYRPVFGDVVSRDSEALSRLDSAAASGGRPARLASYLKGVQLLQSGQHAAALAQLESVSGRLGDDPTMGVLVKASLATALEAEGRADEALAIWSELAEEGSSFPRDLALEGLARVAEAAGDVERARSTLKTLVEEFPGSPSVSEAEAALARLGA